jgi:hypothetical protein
LGQVLADGSHRSGLTGAWASCKQNSSHVYVVFISDASLPLARSKIVILFLLVNQFIADAI